MADKFIECAARAALDEMVNGVHPAQQAYVDAEDLTNTSIDGRINMIAVTRAVLRALRNIDLGGPGALVAGKQSLFSCSEDPELSDARKCWQAMIDELLAGSV